MRIDVKISEDIEYACHVKMYVDGVLKAHIEGQNTVLIIRRLMPLFQYAFEEAHQVEELVELAYGSDSETEHKPNCRDIIEAIHTFWALFAYWEADDPENSDLLIEKE